MSSVQLLTLCRLVLEVKVQFRLRTAWFSTPQKNCFGFDSCAITVNASDVLHKSPLFHLCVLSFSSDRWEAAPVIPLVSLSLLLCRLHTVSSPALSPLHTVSMFLMSGRFDLFLQQTKGISVTSSHNQDGCSDAEGGGVR